MPEDNTGLGEFIRMQRRLADLSLRDLAGLARVSNAYLSQVERGVYNPSAEVLKGIAEALDLSAESLYTRAGLLDEDDSARKVGVEEAIMTDDRLSAEQKDVLIRLYRSMVTPS
jgi:transcriptional regulator with XRE-family HTH domain